MSEETRAASWPVDPFPTPAGASGGSLAWPVDPFEVKPSPQVPAPDRPARVRPAGARSDLSFLARGGVLNLASVVSSVLLNFGLVLIITHGFGASTAGVFLELVGLFMIVSNAAEFGADAGFLRLISRYRSLRRTQDVRTMLHVGLWPTVVGGVVLAWAMWAFAPALANLFFKTGGVTDPRATRLIRLLAPFVPLSGVSTALISASRGFGAMLPTVLIENAGKSLFRASAGLVVVVLGLGVYALGVGWSLAIVAGFAIIIVWDRRLLRRAERRDRYDRRDKGSAAGIASEFWRFSLPRGLVGGLSTTQLWLDSLIVGGLRSTREAAIYTVSTRYLAVSAFVIAAMNIVIAPQISSLLSLREKGRAENVYHTATEWIILSSWPPCFVLATFAPLLLSLFGRQYVEGQTVLVILSFAALYFLSTGPLITVLVMGGKSGWSLFNQVLSLTTNIALNLTLVPRYGINGAAWAWALTGLVGQVTALVEVRLFMGLSPYHRRAFLAAIGSAVIYGLGGLLFRLALGATIPAFVSYLVVATGVYAVFVWRFRRQFKLGELRRAFSGRGAERRATLQPT